MTDLSAFPITRRWPAAHPDRIQLYSVPTPNGVKVSIMLEEIGLPYEPHLGDVDNEPSYPSPYRLEYPLASAARHRANAPSRGLNTSTLSG